jgi:primosomal protein N' (replication factor Y) (superfamily II helicase)
MPAASNTKDRPTRQTAERLALVAFPLPLRREFIYCVPPEWEEVVHPGTRVEAILGGRKRSGVVVSCPVDRDVSGTGVRPLTGVLDLDLSIPPDVLSLARWVADYYLCAWGEALGAGLGPSLAPAKILFRQRSLDQETGRDSRLRLTPADRRILQRLSQSKPTSRASLARLGLRPRAVNNSLKSLIRRNLVVAEWKTTLPPLPKDAVITGLNEDADPSLPPQVRDFFGRIGSTPAGRTWIEVARQFPGGQRALRALMLDGTVLWEPVPPASMQGVPKPIAEPEPSRFDDDQLAALDTLRGLLDSRRFASALLWGPTGSGKTAVYCSAIRHTWSLGRNVLFLVPEIGLAGQMINRLETTLGESVGVWHSGLTPAQRYWMARLVARGRYRLVIGARSAVFAPIPDLGLIIVDEEHGESFKQSDPAPRYHARDVAVVRARITHAVCLLGSATPSCESYHNAQTGKYTMLRLKKRVQGRSMPLVRLVDLSKRPLSGPDGWITPELKEALQETLRTGRKAIVFLNRRGYSTVVACKSCGFFLVCPRCDLTLTYHASTRQFRCHFCDHTVPAYESCPKCHGTEFLFRGVGTQKIEETLSQLDAPVSLARLDADIASRRGAAGEILHGFAGEKYNLLVGTQMVAKGLDVAEVGLVGVVWADQQMAFPDFRAEEKTFQLLTQVAGRAGRGEASLGGGEVLVQTFRPAHDLIELAAAQDALSFFARELPRRRALGYPPFSHLILLAFTSPSLTAARAGAMSFDAHWRASGSSFGRLLGPAPAAVPRRAGNHIVHVLLKIRSMKSTGAVIIQYLDQNAATLRKSKVNLSIDVDPVDFW